MPDRTCGNCSADIAHRRSNARHCSDQCKRLASEGRRRADGRLQAQWTKSNARKYVPTRTATCPECGAEFEHRHGNRKHCSRTCRDAASMQTVLDRRKAARKAAAGVDPRRRCRFCGALVAYAVKERPACRGCQPLVQAARARRRRAERKLVRAAEGTRSTRRIVTGLCLWCGELFAAVHVGNRNAPRVCSRRCGGKIRSARREARERAAFVEDVHPYLVFERDEWTCHICAEPIPRRATVPDLRAATLDHVVALAAGGLHEYANVKAAHFLCNSTKRDLPLALALVSA